MKFLFKIWLLIAILVYNCSIAQPFKSKHQPDSLCGAKVNVDAGGKLLGRYFPENTGKGYHKAITLAAEFIKNSVPLDDITGKPLLFVTCCFQGPHMTLSTEVVQGKSIGRELSLNQQRSGIVGEHWMHNPACVYAGLTQSLALDMYTYTGDKKYIERVRDMLDYQLKYGTTPSHFEWAHVPYSSSNPFDTLYYGATKWENEGMRGDGLHGIEPDKVAEMGVAYAKFYQITSEEKYYTAALHCAKALAYHVQTNVLPQYGAFIATQTKHSPWPFRVNARNGKVIDTYCAHVVEPIRLFDEMLKLHTYKPISDTALESRIKSARKIAMDWLFSRNGPMKTYVWNGYFEDIPNDEGQANRNQVTPMETARYMLKNVSQFPNYEIDVQALIYYVKSAFGTEGIDAIKEQTWCYEPMASHSARYASVCAMYYALSKNPWFKEQALRHFNYATYAIMPNGVAWVGHTWPGSWWSDGYGDFIKHFFDGIAAIPEWAPEGEDHILKSTSVIKEIHYTPTEIAFTTFDREGSIVARLQAKPKSIISESGKLLTRYTWEPLNKGGILRLAYDNSNQIRIKK